MRDRSEAKLDQRLSSVRVFHQNYRRSSIIRSKGSGYPKSSRPLFQVQDLTLLNRFNPPTTAVESIAPQSESIWVYQQPTGQRGVYQWDRLVLCTGAPIGLFWFDITP